MTDCISRDRLVDLLSVIDEPAVPVLDHLASCTECRVEVASIERVRELIGAEQPLPAGFVDHIMHRIEATVPDSTMSAADSRSPTKEVLERHSPKSRVPFGLNTALVALLAGVAACVVLMAMTSAAPAAEVTPLSLVMTLLAGTGLTAYQLTRPQHQPLDTTSLPLDEPNF